MSEDKKRAPRRLPFQDELELHLRYGSDDEVEGVLRRAEKEMGLRKLLARRLPLLDQEPKA